MDLDKHKIEAVLARGKIKSELNQLKAQCTFRFAPLFRAK